MKEKRIVVAQSGWVFMGDYTNHKAYVALDNASCIRAWGTTAGLGQIALHGPTKDTILDPVGYVDIPITSVVVTIKCVFNDNKVKT